MHKRNVEDRRNSIKKLKRLIRQKDDENSSLDNDLEEISLSVAERRNVNDANGKENEKHINSVAFFYQRWVLSCRSFSLDQLHVAIFAEMPRFACLVDVVSLLQSCGRIAFFNEIVPYFSLRDVDLLVFSLNL